MEKFTPTNLKGATDSLPEIQAMRNRVTDILRENFERNGFLPIETPILNHLDLLTHKYDANAEIVREIYKMKDQGERDIGLRYDLTVPFAKFIAMNRNLKMPFRRYEIGRVFRNGPVRSGRLREFYQCDIDCVGQDGPEIEAEIIALMVKCFLQLGIKPVIMIGNRKVLIGYITAHGVLAKDVDSVIGVIDRIEKVSEAETLRELEKFISSSQAKALLDSFCSKEMPEEVAGLFKMLEGMGISEYCRYTPSLARGLNYYTGTIFEAADAGGEYSGSIGGGGRYNDMVTDFIDNGLSYPAIGVSFGLEPIMAILKAREENQRGCIDLLVIPMNTFAQSHIFAEGIRALGARVLVLPQKVGKAMEYANATGIPFTCVVGQKELDNKKINIKRMSDGEQTEFATKDSKKIAKFILEK